MAIVGIAAVGETIVIISGGFDLSIGSVMAASGMVVGIPRQLGVPLPVAFACASDWACAIGATNGAIISYARINPLITTLATLAIVRGLGYVVSGGRELVVTDATWLALGYGIVPGHPVHGAHPRRGVRSPSGSSCPGPVRPVRLRHRLERQRRAAGGCARSIAGGSPIYLTCGALAAWPACVTVARTGNAQPSAALGIELDVITAVILGGTSLTRRAWPARRHLVGLLLLGVVNNGLTLARRAVLLAAGRQGRDPARRRAL